MSSATLSNSNPFDNSATTGGNDDMISFFSRSMISTVLDTTTTIIERIEALHKRSLAEVEDGSEGFTANQLASLGRGDVGPGKGPA